MRRAGNSSKAQPLWQKGLSERVILKKIDRFVKGNIQYDQDRILGFPGTTPNDTAVEAYIRHLSSHPNNIGLHTNNVGRKSEVGFSGTQEAERRVIAMAADLLGGRPNQIDGYISSGGTEANIVGCWIGRNCHPEAPTAIVCSFLTHYSITKAANLLGIGIEPKKKSGLHLLGADDNGRVLLGRLEEKLHSLAKNGTVNIIIIGNAGATMLGSVDDIPAMNSIADKMSRLFPATNFHLHVDAAMGGFIAPFIDGLPSIGFENSRVCSAAVDVHKLGLAPYGSGIILARRGLFEKVKSIAPYVPGNDSTLCGSRAGVMALSCWAVMRKLGKNGYAKNAKDLMGLTRYAQRRFKELGIETFNSDINIVAVKESFPGLLNRKFITHIQESFPADLSSPFSGDKRCVWNIVVMRHTTQSLLDELFLDIQSLRGGK